MGTSAGAKQGLFIRGGDILEAMSRVDTVVFDKTGTLTEGRPLLTRILTESGPRPNPSPGPGVLELAAALEESSRHPIAQAIVAEAKARVAALPPVREGTFRQEPGSGVVGEVAGRRVTVGSLEWAHRHLADRSVTLKDLEHRAASLHASTSTSSSSPETSAAAAALSAGHVASSRTAVYVTVNGALAGAFEISDRLRDGAADTVTELRRRGLRVAMLSGDQPGPAGEVARAVGIDPADVYAGVKPDGKAARVQALRAAGRTVAMVGDGVNDAAALAESHVGIAMGGGVEAAADVAKIVLLRDQVTQVVDAVDLSCATFRKIQQNMVWAFGYNVIGIPLAAGAFLPRFGLALTPSIAGALMGVSSLGVMSNSLLLQWDVHRRQEAREGARARARAAAALAAAAARPVVDSEAAEVPLQAGTSSAVQLQCLKDAPERAEGPAAGEGTDPPRSSNSNPTSIVETAGETAGPPSRVLFPGARRKMLAAMGQGQGLDRVAVE